MEDALFVRDGDTYVPSLHTTGPWDRRAQHAGAPAALLGGAVERLETEVPMQVARFTLELLRPVPVTPLQVSAHVVRPGRRVQLSSASAFAAGEKPSPLQRVLAAADFGNGISAPFEFLTTLYINTELTVHLHRLPDADWVCLDSHTAVESTGIGLTQSALYDPIGPLGRGAQALLIDRRAPANPGP